MRCIEILALYVYANNSTMINKNMRCIEIVEIQHIVVQKIWINKNMRCIEIRERTKSLSRRWDK